MVKIRLKRLGYKRNPIYRVIVINSREKREGRAIAELGHYNPRRKELKLNKEAASEWIKKGAQPTDTVKYLIDNSDENGNLVRKQVAETKLSKKAKTKQEAQAKEAATPKAETPVKEEAPKAEAPAQEEASVQEEAAAQEEATA